MPFNYEHYVNLQKRYTVLFHSHEPFELFGKKQYIKNITNFYVVSEEIKKKYNENGYTNVNVGEIFIDQQEIDHSLIKSNEIIVNIKNRFRSLDKSKIIVGMCGTFVYRKGHDIFIKAAKKYKSLEFIWIGGICTIRDYPVNFFHIPHTDNPYKYYKLLDIFFLSSRQEATPYVIEEVKLFGKPIVYKADDIIKYKKGETINYNNIVSIPPTTIINLITKSRY